MSVSYLVHAGTKGQKWGVRHWQHKDGSFTEEGKYRYGRKKRPGEDISKLSDQELRDKLNRARMEREYKQLTAKPESEGHKLVKKILISAATGVGIGLVSNSMKGTASIGHKLVKKVLKKVTPTKVVSVVKKVIE